MSSNKMLIDATHPEETRVVVLRGGRVEEFDYESVARKPLRGNIYLAKVTRVEPSLQAAFVDYGGNRHGFLAFNEIHPDYYQIPVADRQMLIEEEVAAEAAEEALADAQAERLAQRAAEFPDDAARQDWTEPLEPRTGNGGLGAAGEAPAEAHGLKDQRPAGAKEPATNRPRADVYEFAAPPVPAESAERTDEPDSGNGDADSIANVEPEQVESVGSEDALEELPSRPRRRMRPYKIQEVIKRRQVILVQVQKEERGNKGAALTTYLSLAGRYTVLMPNSGRGGGISRKITNVQDRKRLKIIAAELDVPEGMGLIIRTAGAARTKAEIKRDFEYLLRLWENVRELTLQSTAASLVYEEGDLIKRSIRDLYTKDVEEIVVAGGDTHKAAKDFMRMLMPSHTKNVTLYERPDPIFSHYQVERQLAAMFSPYVQLASGGYLVINQAEALVAIDVNSGKATREFSIEDTALGTNLEAAEEIARQLKLRDLAGLIVIDFIDMEEKRNNRAVERRLKDCLRNDRARIQVGRISHFGLLEMSRQRLRTGVLEGSTSQCPHCQGSGIVRSTESIALAVLRGLDEQLIGGTRGAPLIATTTAAVALYVLNNKRSYINELEVQNDAAIVIQASDKLHGANFVIEKAPRPQPLPKRIERTAVNMDWGFQNEVSPAAPNGEPEAAAFADGEADPRRTRRLRRRRGGREDGFETAGELAPYRDEPPVEEIRNESADVAAPRATVADTAVDAAPDGHAPQDDADRDGASDAARRGRRRGQRGGRRRDRETQVAGEGEQPAMIDIVERSSDRAAGEPQPDLFIPSQAERQPEKQAERQVEAIVTADTRPLEPAPANPEPTDASVAPPPVPVELPPSRRIVPTAGEPVLERVVVGPDVAANSETPPPVDPPPARRKGWWLRRSSDA